MIDINSAATLLGGKARGNKIRCPGPGHSKHDRSLSVTFNSDGTFVTVSFAEDDFRICRDHVKARLGLSDDRPVPKYSAPIVVPHSSDDEPARIRNALRYWQTAVPIAGTNAENYLASRGLAYSGTALRFRPNCGSMVALMTDAITGEPCGVHRTFLNADGVKTDRKMYGRAGVVRLYDWEPCLGLGIAEGIETTLATGFVPAWACLSAGGLQRLPVLPGIESITIFADNDENGTGLRAARACADRWHDAGCEVTVEVPTETGVDFATMEAA